ncbi:MAG: tetratricopeptide repeat protein [Candidatus Lokiarchaeota archaeon]|nr:tetratricopeptide repeat protein [Candidatus Lokiarchaeota archaeon]
MMTPSEDARGAVETAFPPGEEYAFLIGAGVSMNPPSSVPGARTIVKSLLSYCAPAREVEPLTSHPALRYELLVEWIKALYDPELRFLEYLDLIKEPNIIHHFLARLVQKRHVVITTNFDYLIEHALKASLPPEKHGRILPVITRQDFVGCQDIGKLWETDLLPVVKIHGSRKNVMTDELTIDTLITTISSLGKGKEEGSTFAIEPHKKPLVYNALAGRVLVVMGYSGSDDFDITPLLMEVPFVKKLVWIEHDAVPSPVIARIGEDAGDGRYSSRTDQLLRALGQRGEFEVVKVRCSTAGFIKEALWPLLVGGDVVPPELADGVPGRPDFRDWIRPLFEGATVPQQYFFAAQVYYVLKELEATARCCQDGLAAVAGSPVEDAAIRTQLLNLQGNIEQIHGRNQEALALYLEAHEVNRRRVEAAAGEGERRDARALMATDLNNIATALTALGNYREALRYLREGLEQEGTSEVVEGEIPLLNNIGHVHELRNDYQAALAAYRRGLGAANREGDLPSKMTLLNNIGRIQLETGQRDAARASYEEAARLASELGDPHAQMILANNLARWAMEAGDDESAGRELRRALDLATMLDDKAKMSGILSNLGSIALQAGDAGAGLERFEAALGIMRKVGDPQMLLIYLNNIGQVHERLGDLQRAVQHYGEAYERARDIQDAAKQALLLSKIGGVAFKNQDWAKATELYEASTNLYEQVRDWPNLVSVLSNLVQCHKNQKDLAGAIPIAERAASIDERLGDKVSLGMDLKQLGDLHAMAGDRAAAAASYNRAMALFEEAGNEEYAGVVRKVMQDLEPAP